MFAVVVSALVPVFGLIALGFGVGRSRLLGDHGFDVLNQFVILIALPALTFVTLAKMSVSALVQPSMVAAVAGGALILYFTSFILERLLGRTAAAANIVALGSSYGNTAFVGLPVCLAVLGQESLPPAALTVALNASIIFGTGVWVGQVVLHRDSGITHGASMALRAIIRNPLIVSAVLGVACAVLRLEQPRPVEVLLRMLGATTAPCALVAIGLFIATQKIAWVPWQVIRIALLKLVALPLLTLVFLLWLLPPLPPLWTKVAILMAAMPTGTSSFLLAGGAGREAMETSSLAIVVTTIASAFSLTATLWLLGV